MISAVLILFEIDQRRVRILGPLTKIKRKQYKFRRRDKEEQFPLSKVSTSFNIK